MKMLLPLFVATCLMWSFSGAVNPPVMASTPAIKLSVVQGGVGIEIKATISGFPAKTDVRVRFDAVTIAHTATNGRGRRVITFVIPESVAGGHIVRANSGRTTVESVFLVTSSLAVSPGSVRPGGTVSLQLTGYGAGERVGLWLLTKNETKRLATVRTSASGSAAKGVTIPVITDIGTGSIEGRGETGTIASSRLKIKAASKTGTSTPTSTPVESVTGVLTGTALPTLAVTSTPTLGATATETRTSTARPSATSAPTQRATSTPAATATTSGGVISIWVDPAHGNDRNSGAARGEAVRTLDEAWNRIPAGATLTSGYRIRLAAGSYPASGLPNYMESRYGTEPFPITIEAADDAGSAVLTGSLNIFDVRYLTLSGLTLRTAGDVVHCELCIHFSILNSTLDGQGAAHETLKINQSQYVTVDGSDLGGSYENAIDFVAVQHGSITNNTIHDAEDWCMYLKGGSADFWIEGNEISSCGTGGFTAGQGTGFQFMVSPWITYEAVDITFIRNEIHDTDGAGMGVNGGKNILLAENHLVRVGARSHILEIGFGGRSCDGQPGDEGRDRCAEYLSQGGWGTTVVDDGDNYVRIPNKNVIVRDNVFDNPSGYQSRWQHFFIAGPYSGASQSGSNAPNPAHADDGLVITGNVILNGDETMSLGLGDESGCQSSNPTCNEVQLYADNDINGR